MFEAQREGRWSGVSKAVMCGDVGEEGARSQGEECRCSCKCYGKPLEVPGGGTQSNLYLRMSPPPVGGKQTVGAMLEAGRRVKSLQE